MYTAKFFSDVCLFATGVKLQHLKTTLISKSNDENMDLFRASKVTDVKGLSFFFLNEAFGTNCFKMMLVKV